MIYNLQLVARLTKDIVETYKKCNPQFKFSEDLNPKRYLTTPSSGVLNDGHDNVNSDLILSVNCPLLNLETQRRYIVKDVLGQGTFGQVAKCWVVETNSFVAVKIIKNQPAYYQQALVEVSILTMLNKKYDPEDKHHIVRIYDYFVHHRHLCICFELLDTNLYELIKINQFRGLSLSIVQLFSKQILRGLALLKDAGIIHCDLKPENILLCTSLKPAEVKIIDFGSACMEDRTVYSYIQSRYYRSPEVLLGYQYTAGIDMWSFGCIVAELFLGLPLFPGASEFDLLRRMVEILGGQPPDYVLKEAKSTSKFFKCIGSACNLEGEEALSGGRSAYQALTIEEYEERELKKPSIGKEYFNRMNLETIVTSYPYRKNLAQEDIMKERQVRLALIDFLKGLVEFDPAKRWSPFQASKHPFVTGEPFTCPYIPPPESRCLPVAHTIKVDHHPGGGHWFAAGLSPNSGISIPSSQSSGSDLEKLEDDLSLPDPGDWDPNYSDELLLQEDDSDAASLSAEFSKGVNLGSGNPSVAQRRSSHPANPSSHSLIQRQNGYMQSFLHANVGSPPSAHELHPGYGRAMSNAPIFTPHLSQNSPSRLGQQAVPRNSHGRPPYSGDWNQIKVQPPPQSSFNSGGPLSPGSIPYSNSLPWGRRSNYPGTSIPPPTSRGRKDHGRIV
ncbi:Dual specificity protein kinase YAK1 homolog [Linum grandiflorum]